MSACNPLVLSLHLPDHSRSHCNISFSCIPCSSKCGAGTLPGWVPYHSVPLPSIAEPAATFHFPEFHTLAGRVATIPSYLYLPDHSRSHSSQSIATFNTCFISILVVQNYTRIHAVHTYAFKGFCIYTT